MRKSILADSVKVNRKPSNKAMYLLAKAFPRLFKQREHLHLVRKGWASGVRERDALGRFIPRYILEERHVYNTVTSAAKIRTADWLQSTPSVSEKPSHMAVGTGTPSATALGTELDRNALTSSTTSGTAVLTMQGDWAAGDATGAITEAGVFDTSSGATMWLSASFAVINKGALDTLQIIWTFTIA